MAIARMLLTTTVLGYALAQGSFAQTTSAPASAPATQPTQALRDELRREASALATFVETPLARRFLEAVEKLPAVEPRSVFILPDRKQVLTREQADALPKDEQARLRERVIDESYYYQTRYGSPLAYVRAMDLLAKNGLTDLRERQILDFGYGMCGQLILMRELGATVVGVDVDPTLPVIYPELNVDAKSAAATRVRIVNGRWPATDEVRAQVGAPFDLILSKNTLKAGYIHPERPVDERMTIQLGVDDETFIRCAFEGLKPGGYFMIYNLCPAPAPPDKPYIPWANGRSPFPREMFEKAGFRVIEFDHDDAAAAREMGKRLGWADPPTSMNLESDLFAWYTLLRRPE